MQCCCQFLLTSLHCIPPAAAHRLHEMAAYVQNNVLLFTRLTSHDTYIHDERCASVSINIDMTSVSINIDMTSVSINIDMTSVSINIDMTSVPINIDRTSVSINIDRTRLIVTVIIKGI